MMRLGISLLSVLKFRLPRSVSPGIQNVINHEVPRDLEQIRLGQI